MTSLADLKKKTATKPATPAKSVAKKSRFEGVDRDGDQTPMPHVGLYRLRLKKAVEEASKKTQNMFWKGYWEIVECDDRALESHAVGDTVMCMFPTSGNGARSGLQKLKSCVWALAQADGRGLEEGVVNALCDAACDDGEAFELIGREVLASVRKGKSIPDTDDYYREYDWTEMPVGD